MEPIIEKLCSIIILSYNKIEYTIQCLDSIRNYTTDVPYEIIVVDNASNDETVRILEQREDILLVRSHVNLGFAGGCNLGIKYAKGEYIMLLNNDTLVTEKWLLNMYTFLREHPEASMTGPLTNATVGKQMIPVPYGDDMQQMQKFAATLANGKDRPYRTLRLVFFCVLIRKKLFEEIGLLDTDFLVGNYEDDDFNIRALLAGKEAYICTNSFIHHFMNISFQQKNVEREKVMMNNKLVLEKKWDSLDWNHHAVYNRFILEQIVKYGGKRILCLGCGLGALAIELKDRDEDYYIAGMEEHPIRNRIASRFLDCVYHPNTDWNCIMGQQDRYDVIVIEGMVEQYGIDFLQKVKPICKEETIVCLRVFNHLHITTLEKEQTGQIGGNLLCAVSPQFHYYYDGDISELIGHQGFEVVEVSEVRKSLSTIQQTLETGNPEQRIYNRIYVMKGI